MPVQKGMAFARESFLNQMSVNWDLGRIDGASSIWILQNGAQGSAMQDRMCWGIYALHAVFLLVALLRIYILTTTTSLKSPKSTLNLKTGRLRSWVVGVTLKSISLQRRVIHWFW